MAHTTLTRRLPSEYDIDAAASLISSTVLTALDEGT